MPRSLPPGRLCTAILEPFELSTDSRREISAALGLRDLPLSMVRALEARISDYKMQLRLPSVSPGANIAAIDEALNTADAFEAALRPFTDQSHGGAGSKTVHVLRPFARDTLQPIMFRLAALARRSELRRYKRFGPEHGPLGGLCALVRFLFEITQEARKAPPKKEHLHSFARAVLQAADISCDNYINHPSRLDKLFTPPIPDSPQTRLFIAELRLEIAELIR
jgi:hypothetical protein